MSKSTGYQIDWNRNTITMTKSFAAKASQIGTNEYEQLMNARANGFHVVEKWYKPRKACPTRLTYKKMRNYIATRPDADAKLEEFKKVIEKSKSYHNSYEYVRQWFIGAFPEHVASLKAHAAKKDNILQFPNSSAAANNTEIGA